MQTSYREFLDKKLQHGSDAGFDPINLPDFLFDFQKSLCEWAIRKGRSAIFADCGLGKGPMQLVWADNVVKKTNLPVMLATPIAVSHQMIREAEKFGIEARRTRDGRMTNAKCIWVTNYEQLYKYDPLIFGGFSGDESSCIKDMKSERKSLVTEFTRQIPYRLFCTATAAPNDYWELGTTSEALGYLGVRDMLTHFFKMVETGGARWSGIYGQKYRFRGHAEHPFWSWVCSWARSLRKPSDLGFDDTKFILPPLFEQQIVVKAKQNRAGQGFFPASKNLREEREERRNTIEERCEKAAELILAEDGPSTMWCELNGEADRMESLLPDCVQVKGSMSDAAKEEALLAFTTGQVKRIVTKPKIGAWGLNWQHCSNVVCFPSHSFEQYYQLVRRCYRFGQEKPVRVISIVCEGEQKVLKSLQRKQQQAIRMFENIVSHMRDSMFLGKVDKYPLEESVPLWL